jgi:hypothetical protein
MLTFSRKIRLGYSLLQRFMDARVKPAHDAEG